jgi:UDP-glucose 4-epimerase
LKVIVTGGAGFVGSHLVEYLISKKHYPIIIDNLKSGKYNNIKQFVTKKQADFHKIDIRNLEKLKKVPKVDAIIHLAAVASVVESITNPSYVNDVNVNGTLTILEFCKLKKIEKMIFISSGAIFSTKGEEKVSEISNKIPDSVYGASKLCAEDYCRIFSKLFEIKTVILRPFNIYGLRQNEEYAGVISKFLLRIKNKKAPIIFGDGKQTRDFIHVHDICRAIEKSLKYNKKRFNDFNLATGNSITIKKLADIMISNNNYNKKIIFKKQIPGVVKYSAADVNKAKNELKFKTTVDLRKGLNEILE